MRGLLMAQVGVEIVRHALLETVEIDVDQERVAASSDAREVLRE